MDLGAANATIAVTDLTRARAFYEGTLELSMREERFDGLVFESGGSEFLVYPSSFAGTAKSTLMGFETTDVEAVVKDLRSKGVAIEDYDFPGLKTTDGIAEIEGVKSAWFKDPDGNILAVAQRT